MKKNLLFLGLFAVCAFGVFGASAAVVHAAADLTITDFHLTDAAGNAKTTFAPGEEIYPSITIKNIGDAATVSEYPGNGFFTGIYSNAPGGDIPALMPSDVNVYATDQTPLGAGQSKTYSKTSNYSALTFGSGYYGAGHIWVPIGAWTASLGSYTARAFVDSFNYISESNESNNQATATYSVSGAAVSSTAATGSGSVITVIPGSANVPLGFSQQFSWTSSDSSTKSVTWSSGAGFISQSGLFTAPGSAQSVTIVATSVQNPSESGRATVLVTGTTLTGGTGSGSSQGSGTTGSGGSTTGTAAITSIQGYDPSTIVVGGLTENVTYSPNTAIDGTYIILHGVFGSSGNQILIDGNPILSKFITFASASQITVSASSSDGIGVGNHSVSVVTPFGTTAPVSFAIITSGAASANAQTMLFLNGGAFGNFIVGAPWTLSLTSPELNTEFTLCNRIGEERSCTPNWDTTDAHGSWTSKTGSFSSITTSTWYEWIQFPDGTQSNQISFNVSAGAATSTQPVAPSLSLNGATSGNFYTVGQPWTLNLTNGPLNASFTLCNIVNGNTQNPSCTPNWGSTDGSGSWTSAAGQTFAANATGTWIEWVQFANGTQSNLISFVVLPMSSSAGGVSLSLNGGVSGNYAVGQPWTINLTSDFPNTSFTLCNVINGNTQNQSCTPNSGVTDMNGAWTSSSTFDSSTAGQTWTEWIKFASGAQSNAVSFTVSPITGVQGYDPTVTPSYTNSTVDAGQYLVLYGAFASSGNQVSIDGNVMPASSLNFESLGQINVAMTGIAAGSHRVTVTLPGGVSGTASFSIIQGTGAGSSVATSSGSGSGATDGSCVGSPTVTAKFPVTVTVVAASLHVRSGPHITSPVAGSGTLSAGDMFQAQNEVMGDCVGGTDLWWESVRGNYVWSGGTTFAAAGTPTASSVTGVSSGIAATSLNEPITKTVTSGGVQYSVVYSYLADGEVRATFSYSGKQYVEQNQDVAYLNADGTLGAVPLPATPFAPLTNLISQIYSASPSPRNVLWGFSFDTVLYQNEYARTLVPVGEYNATFNGGGLGLVTLSSNQEGSITAVKSVGNFGTYYIADNAVIVAQENSLGQLVYAVFSPDLASSLVLDLKDVSITNDSSGNPSQISGRFDITSGAYSSTPSANATAPVTFALGATNTNQSSGVSGPSFFNFNNPNVAAPSFVVIDGGQIINFVNAGGVAAYKYIQSNALKSVGVVPLSGGGYAVVTGMTVTASFDENGNQLNESSGSSSTVPSVLGGLDPSDYLSNFISQLSGEGYQISENTDASGEAVGTASKDGQVAFYFSLGNQVVSGVPRENSGQCIVNAQDGTPVPVLVTPSGTIGTIAHLDKNFNLAVDSSAYAAWSQYTPETAQSDLLGIFNVGYKPYSQVAGLPQPVETAGAGAVVILSYANIPDGDNWTFQNGQYVNDPSSFGAQAITIIPGNSYSSYYVPSGSSDVIIQALNAGKEVMVITLNSKIFTPPSALNDVNAVDFVSSLASTLQHEMGHPLGLADDYPNGASPMREGTSSVPVDVSPGIADVLSRIQKKGNFLATQCGVRPAASANTVPGEVNEGFVPIVLPNGSAQWGYAGSCTDGELSDGWVNAPDCTGNTPPAWCAGSSEGCYMPTSNVNEVVSFGNFPDQTPTSTCLDNFGGVYYCAATDCGGAGQLSCTANVPKGTCLDAAGQVASCSKAFLPIPEPPSPYCINVNSDCPDQAVTPGVKNEDGSCGATMPICSSTVEPSGEGGYDCSSNGLCVYDPNGGTYAQSSCDDACEE